VTTLAEDPSAVQPLEDDADSALEKSAYGAPFLATVLRASISMRGHFNASLNLMRQMAQAAKEGNLAEVKSLGWEAEALIAENVMLGLDTDRVPSMPLPSEKFTLDFVERIFGVQRARIAARDVNQVKKVGR
jgi:hypothetical protein